MSDISELAEEIARVGGKIGQVVAEMASAVREAEETASMAEAIGAETTAGQLEQVRDQLDALAGTLTAASVQVAKIQALILSVAAGKSQGGPSATQPSPTASRDPATVSAPSPKRRSRGREKFREKLASLTEQAEGVGDLVSYTEKVRDGAQEFFKGSPNPPEITGAGTRTPTSPPIASSTAPSGADLPSAASGFAVVGIFAFGVKHAVKRTIRGIRAEEQVPEEIPPPPRTRYPWEDAQGDDPHR